MFKEVNLLDIETDGFLHSQINEFILNYEKKIFIVKLTGADLKTRELFYNCTMSITDWWNLEVIEKGKNVFKRYLNEEIPTYTDQIIKYEYAENILTLKTYGSLSIDSVLYYIFTKPKIKITGEYDPD